jgi:hypothetical protein
MGVLATAALMVYIGLVIVGIFKISPKYMQDEIMERLQSIGGN